MLVDGQWWLDRDAVTEIATELGIDAVPYLGRMTLGQIVDLVRTPFLSRLVRPSPRAWSRVIEPLFDRRMKRIIIKLKTKDFVAGKR